MTREEAIEIVNKGKCPYPVSLKEKEKNEAFDMAISALSEELSEDGTLTVHVKDGSKVKRVFVMGDNIFGGLYYPDSAEIESTTVDELKDILKWGHCYCDSENLSAYKAIKNAIAIISSLETLKAEIKNNTDHCECVPDGACISVEKVIGLIDSHLKLSESTESEADNKSEWIPVSKRLPDVGSVVYGQLADGSHEILFMDDFDGQMTWRGRWRSNYNVIAWREMPEPYKEEG